jgi:hypothetical protein
MFVFCFLVNLECRHRTQNEFEIRHGMKSINGHENNTKIAKRYKLFVLCFIEEHWQLLYYLKIYD